MLDVFLFMQRCNLFLRILHTTLLFFKKKAVTLWVDKQVNKFILEFKPKLEGLKLNRS